MASGLINDASIIATSKKDDLEPKKARLNGPEAWCCTRIDAAENIQINLLKVHRLTGIGIQGYRRNDTYTAYVTSIYISYWAEESFWHWYFYGSPREVKVIHLLIGIISIINKY